MYSSATFYIKLIISRLERKAHTTEHCSPAGFENMIAYNFVLLEESDAT